MRFRFVASMLALVVMLSSSLRAQISIPDEVDAFAPLIVGCNCILPEPLKGQRIELTQTWSIRPLTDKATSHVALVPPGTEPQSFSSYVGDNPQQGKYAAVWASIGKHEIRTNFMWVLLEDVEVSTPDGGTRVIAHFVKMDQSTWSKEFEVVGFIPEPIPPGPEPGPDPGPNPNPDIPDGEHGLTKYSYDLALSVQGEYRGFAAELGANYIKVAQGLESGAYLSIGVANEALTSLNRETVKGEPAKNEWRTKFFVPHGGKMSNLQLDGKVTDEKSLARAYNATGEGLKFVK